MNNAPAKHHEIEVFYDGACPLCLREISWLRRRDRHGKISFIDISAADFDPAAFGKTSADLMAKMHGRLPDGTWVQGVEVFRRLYAAVGFVRMTALTRLPLISHALDWGYSIFARNRLRWTGRCTPDTCAVQSPAGQTIDRRGVA